VINKAQLIFMSSSVSLEAMFVSQLFADGKLTVAKVARRYCVSDMGLSQSIFAVVVSDCM